MVEIRPSDCGMHQAHEVRLNENERRLGNLETDSINTWKEIGLMKEKSEVSHDVIEKEIQHTRDDLQRRIGEKMPTRHALLLASVVASAVIALFALNYNATLQMTAAFQDSTRATVEALAALNERMVKVETILEEREQQYRMSQELKEDLKDYMRSLHGADSNDNLLQDGSNR